MRAKFLWAAILAVLVSAGAQAAPGTLSSCSGTATNVSAAITFAPRPQVYLDISNPHTANVLWVNAVGGAAAANTAGSMAIPVNGHITFVGAVVPGAINIIAPAGNTAYTCAYR